MPLRLERRYGQHDFHFITFSCYRRLPLLGSARARDVFVEVLGEVRGEFGVKILGYVVMPEHVHLLIDEIPASTPSRVLQVLKQRVSNILRKESRESARPRIFLAAPFLRLQRLEPEQTEPETPLHAHESDRAGFGSASEGMAVEQLFVLLPFWPGAASHGQGRVTSAENQIINQDRRPKTGCPTLGLQVGIFVRTLHPRLSTRTTCLHSVRRGLRWANDGDKSGRIWRHGGLKAPGKSGRFFRFATRHTMPDGTIRNLFKRNNRCTSYSTH